MAAPPNKTKPIAAQSFRPGPLEKSEPATIRVDLLILLHGIAEHDPYGRGKETETAKYQERRRESDPLRDPAAQRRTERRARALNGDDRALREIDAAGAVKRARDHAGHGHA